MLKKCENCNYGKFLKEDYICIKQKNKKIQYLGKCQIGLQQKNNFKIK